MNKTRRGKLTKLMALVVTFVTLGAGSAHAGTITYDGDAIVFTGGDDLDHELQFRFDAATGRDHVIDSQEITSAPGDCQYEGTTTRVSCPGHVGVRVDLGAGRDRVFFNGTSSEAGDCFDTYVIDLGEGRNETTMYPACENAAVGTVTGGSDEDTLSGGSATQRLTIDAGGGNDDVNGGDGADVIRGGEGDDGVFGAGGNDEVYGEGGNDQLRGGPGNDTEDGGPGDDDIGFRGVNVIGEPDPGADRVRGGTGVDLLRMNGHAGGMAISLDGQANDGTSGEGDNIGSDIETILGSTGNDVFHGSPGNNGFRGGQGGDEIHGAGGNDDLRGDGGNDRLFGDAGNDKVAGSSDTDTVDGGPGTDQLDGDVAGCSVFCSPDVDTILARDGERDTVNCGGPGTAQVDLIDLVGRCASVDRPTVRPPGEPPPGTGTPRATFGTVGKLSRAKGVRVRVTCPAACSVTAKLRISARVARKVKLGRRALTIGRGRGTLPAAGQKTLRVKLPARARRKLRRLRTVRASLTVTITDASGRATSTRALKLGR